MYKIYFKQAIAMLKQNKFISLITIVGTALAIMMIMVIIVSDSIKNTAMAPEVNRDRMLYLKVYIKNGKKNDGLSSSSIRYSYLKDYFLPMQTPQKVAALTSARNKSLAKSAFIKNRVPIKLKQVNAAYWDVMSFSFTEGKPFTTADFDSGIKNAVISEEMKQKLFGNEQALGKTFTIDFVPYNVVGVVKNVPAIFYFANANIWIPYTSKEGYEDAGYNVLFLANKNDDFDAIREEIRACERKYNATDDEYTITFMGPYDQRIQELNTSNMPPDEKGAKIRTLFVLLVLLLIPAVNLSSFSISRMKKRTEEIGVRKAFGAKKHIILIQVLYENLITSLLGGFIGLVLSYVAVLWLKEWLLGVDGGSAIPLGTFITLPVFLSVFLVCLLLNLLSSGIPAYRASRINIVNSLNRNNL